MRGIASVALLLVVSLPVQATQDQAKKDLRLFFMQNCSVCHGADGSARGADGKKLKGQDFTDAKDMKSLSDEKMATTIRNGLFFGRRMPAFKDRLSEGETLELVKDILRKAEKGKAIMPGTAPSK